VVSDQSGSKTIEIDHSSTTEDSDNSESESDSSLQFRETHIWVSRKLVYAQAALLGVSAVTFFLLGLMVGNVTAPAGDGSGGNPASNDFLADCRVSGQVTFATNGGKVADPGAVVFLLPTQTKPEKRGAPGLVMPDTFEPLDNPTIDTIHRAGGAVVRADSEGRFEILVDQNRNYRLLVVSKSRTSRRRELTPKQRKALETFFAPPEKLIRDQDFQWREFRGDSESVDVGVIEF
jgi:hypothetical protein